MRTALVAFAAAGLACAGPGERPFVFGRGGDAVGLDPARETDGESFKVTNNLFETLVTFAPDSLALVPALATRWWSDEGGRRWTFRLRGGVRFHDGTALDAAAVVAAFERQFHPDHPFHAGRGGFLYWESMGLSEIIRAVEALDDSTVQFSLDAPFAPLLRTLTMSFCAIPSPTALGRWGDESFKHPIGTGPFRFKEWVKDERVVLAPNDDYWADPPALSGLVFRAIPDNASRLLELFKGSIDGMDGLAPDQVRLVRERSGVRLLRAPGLNVAFLALNCDRPPFDDVRVRRAIHHAVDVRAIVDHLYSGLAQIAATPVPPEVWGHANDLAPYPYDPGRAKRLLAEAGHPEGFSTTLWAMPVPRPYLPQPLKVAETLQADLGRVGVRAEIVTYEWGTYLDKVSAGEHDMCLLGWTGVNADPDNFLVGQLTSAAAVPPAMNVAFYRNTAVDSLLLAARRMGDQAIRTKLYHAAQRLIHADAPWVPLAHTERLVAFQDDVTGFTLHSAGLMRFAWTRLARRE